MSRRHVVLRLWPTWAIPGLVLLLNVVWLAGLRGVVLGRGSVLAGQVTQLESEVGRLRQSMRSLEQSARELESLQGNLNALRKEQLATMKERLLPFLLDVVKRAEEAGLRVERVSYGTKPDEKTGLVYFTAAYGVQGSYEQIRRCVYLLESSPQFIVLEGLALNSEDATASANITVQLRLGTYFSDIDRELLEKLGIKEVASEQAS